MITHYLLKSVHSDAPAIGPGADIVNASDGTMRELKHTQTIVLEVKPPNRSYIFHIYGLVPDRREGGCWLSSA
jgi:hypothetical protein